jgi:cholesterol transport system auxiliary component
MEAMHVRLYRLTGVGIVSLALAGCLSLPREERPIQTFILSLDSSAGGTAIPEVRLGAGILVVNAPVAQPGFDTTRMAYTQRLYEVSYHATHQWADSPARMLAPLLVRSLETTGLWRAVVSVPTAVRGDYQLDISSLVLQQEFLTQPSRTHVLLRAQLVEMKEQRVMGARTFEALEPAPSDDAYGGVLAANHAVAKVLQAVEDWIKSCLRVSPKDNC